VKIVEDCGKIGDIHDLLTFFTHRAA